ncbi:tubulin-like doman-containing protein [Streptomyces griseus]|uniref:tubulin-like doman-containing protein n=1 Tax=Streptomyces griseus TaxID=1911 RepID=UPI0004C7659C|nr:tubulin-like doman-containing protein [Streptomyces griseus]
MKIFQPMLFVGLGGTGGLVGAELERKLRVDLCGPDGTALQHIGGLAPYQLPDCLQFVYADFSESDLQRLPQFNVDSSLRAAYARTSRATHNLLPNFDSSPEVTQMLRASLREEVAGWLPSRDGEPRVTPLHNGAGQLPTVGRAALFATLRHSLQPVLEPLLQAIDAIAKSAGELSELGGGRVTGCDVFVAFSVAGGTGAGIFLDYLHLINQAFKMRRFNGVKIYPLVVMPSSFPAATGGGREAELNAARSLVDLFRLVDGQNAPTAGAELGDLDQETGLGIRYPGVTPVRLRTGILPTAFLFSPTAGIRQDDLRRSIVSLVMSLIGTELGDSRAQGRAMAGDDDFQTFAASFINRGVQRSALSPTGIGRQGVSTSLVASMTAPMDQLADLVAGRLLRVAVTELVERPRNPAKDDTVPLVRRLFADSQLEELWERKQLPVEDPQPLPRGGKAIEEALSNRIGDMQRLLSELQSIADRQAAAMAARFSPRPAIEKLLQSVDPFLAERLVRGVPDSEDEITRLGFLGMLSARARSPKRPPGVTDQPPKTPRIKGRIAGMSPARWGDDDVRAALQAQDSWYRWRCRAVWHEAWREQQQRWQSQADTAGTDLVRLVNAFRKHADQERKSAEQKGLELYAERTGISYLLPPQRSLNHFYEDVVARLVRGEGLRESDDEASLLLRLIDGDTWREVHARSHRDPDGAVGAVKARLEGRITRLFAESGAQLEEHPLLPSMSTLLAAAAGDTDATDQVSKEALDLFSRKLTGLLPVGFTPEGTGPLRVLVTHPRVQAGDEVQEYLAKALRLPSDAKNSVEYRGVESDSITVVLFRSEMSLTQVPEARKVLRQWARAKDDEQAHDVLRWRQRLGFEDDWMVSSEEDRRTILHRLLCCMWNGQVDVLDGGTASPSRVRLRLFPEKGASVPGVRLRLGDFPGGISSWSELLRSYERWTVLDDERTVEDYCSKLMGAQPLGLARAGTEPHPMFVELVERVAPRQLELLEERRELGGQRVDGWIRPLWEFWAETLPAALDMEFGDQRAIQPTLRTLLEHVRGGVPKPPPSRPAPERRRVVADDEDWGTSAPSTDERLRDDTLPGPRSAPYDAEERYAGADRHTDARRTGSARYAEERYGPAPSRDDRPPRGEGRGKAGYADERYTDERPRDERSGDAYPGSRAADARFGDSPGDDRFGGDDRFAGTRSGADRSGEDERYTDSRPGDDRFAGDGRFTGDDRYGDPRSPNGRYSGDGRYAGPGPDGDRHTDSAAYGDRQTETGTYGNRRTGSRIADDRPRDDDRYTDSRSDDDRHTGTGTYDNRYTDSRPGDDRYTDARPDDDRFGGNEPVGGRGGGARDDGGGPDGFGEQDRPPVRRTAAGGRDGDGWGTEGRGTDEGGAGRSRNGGPQ